MTTHDDFHSAASVLATASEQLIRSQDDGSHHATVLVVVRFADGCAGDNIGQAIVRAHAALGDAVRDLDGRALTGKGRATVHELPQIRERLAGLHVPLVVARITWALTEPAPQRATGTGGYL